MRAGEWRLRERKGSGPACLTQENEGLLGQGALPAREGKQTLERLVADHLQRERLAKGSDNRRCRTDGPGILGLKKGLLSRPTCDAFRVHGNQASSLLSRAPA